MSQERTYNDHDMREAYQKGRREAGGKVKTGLASVVLIITAAAILLTYFGIRPVAITTSVNDALATAVVPRATTPAGQNTTTGGSTGSGATTDNGQAAIDAYNATAQAAYQQAVTDAAPVPNIDTTGDTAPNVRVSIPSERQPAGENVPTAEPLAQPQNDGQHGSKSKPVNIQETKTCLHGQVWIDGRGCKNPTPVQP